MLKREFKIELSKIYDTRHLYVLKPYTVFAGFIKIPHFSIMSENLNDVKRAGVKWNDTGVL